MLYKQDCCYFTFAFFASVLASALAVASAFLFILASADSETASALGGDAALGLLASSGGDAAAGAFFLIAPAIKLR